jgi:NAD(P)-dependent dehydrogenase (short-subunit alcohol dehydrogenase family)/uncharacterized OB-fold protein
VEPPVPPMTIPVTPRSLRSRVAQGLTAAAAIGRFELQVCSRCEAVQYPPREACERCLSGSLLWRPQSGAGELLSRTRLHHSHDPYFRERLPWAVGMVRLDRGPTVLAHLPQHAPAPPARVWVSARLDRSGMGVLVASERKDGSDLNDDRRLREMTSDPSDANVLVTDCTSTHAQAMVRALAAAGAARIWVGLGKPREAVGVPAGLRDIPQVTCLRLDVTDENCVREAASAVGSELDILINTADVPAAAAAPESPFDMARAEMEIHYFGLLNLARYFMPSLSARAARTPRLSPAWVNVLSLFALSTYPPLRTFSASMAAAHALSQGMRAQMRGAGVRLVTVFPGPLENERSEGIQQPKLTPPVLAQSIVAGLRSGVEEVYPGEVAREWLEERLSRRTVPETG